MGTRPRATEATWALRASYPHPCPSDHRPSPGFQSRGRAPASGRFSLFRGLVTLLGSHCLWPQQGPVVSCLVMGRRLCLIYAWTRPLPPLLCGRFWLPCEWPVDVRACSQACRGGASLCTPLLHSPWTPMNWSVRAHFRPLLPPIPIPSGWLWTTVMSDGLTLLGETQFAMLRSC